MQPAFDTLRFFPDMEFSSNMKISKKSESFIRNFLELIRQISLLKMLRKFLGIHTVSKKWFYDVPYLFCQISE